MGCKYYQRVYPLEVDTVILDTVRNYHNRSFTARDVKRELIERYPTLTTTKIGQIVLRSKVAQKNGCKSWRLIDTGAISTSVL